MRVSAKSDYALRALIEITQRSGDGGTGHVIAAEEISKAQNIPHGFLQGILADLRRAGLVASQRGQAGGWKMAADPSSVSIADVMRAVDGPIVSISGTRPESVEYNERAVVLQRVWIAARASLRDVLEQTTIAHLAAAKLPSVVERRSRDEDAWHARVPGAPAVPHGRPV
ncbi:MAG TPA: Rrf2 family transcriptional regulator [Kribbellaceae bacterium]|jgi:Rrf2 family protein|nr:Rrf2 family transcriptional regulator [Kribbellaceae bacterium]